MKIDSFKVEDWFNKYEKLALYDMADTCVESLSLDDLSELIGEKEDYISKITSKKLNYGDIHGSDRLRQSILSLYNNPKNNSLTVTHGAIGANSLVMQALIDYGDKVVSVVPTYQQHYSIPKALGANLKTVYLKEENNWIIDVNDLEKETDKDTKLICINNPNNPTGSVIPENIMQKIVDIARKNDCYILCDEVYRGLEHNKKISKSIVELYEKGISTSSMSKVFSLAGLRLGWIIAPQKVMDKIITHREYNTISVSILDDYFSTIALENKDKIIKRNITKILEGKKIMSEWVRSEPKIEWIEPKGGTTCLIKYDLGYSSVDLCKSLLNETGILFLPASTLEMEGYLRAGYCSNLSKLKKGLELFSFWLNK